MAWSRIESSFWRHPKFTGWTPAQKWALGELIGYCCEYRTDGHIPDDLSLLPRSVTKALLAVAAESGWLDVQPDGGYRFHDWNDYHPADPTAAERMRKHRNKKRNEAVTDPVTTNTSTKTNTKTKAFDSKNGETHEPGRIRDAEENSHGPNGSPSEDHGSVIPLDRTQPDRHDEAEVSHVQALIQEQFGTR